MSNVAEKLDFGESVLSTQSSNLPQQTTELHRIGALVKAADSQEGIERLSEVLVDKPQIPAFDTHHFNLPGMYMRKVTITKHSIVVGKIHKMAHFAIIAKGKCAVSGNDGVRGMYEAGDVITSQAGIQRVVVALEDCVFITFHKTNHTDLTDIYNELMESPKFDLYDANNQLKDPMLAQEKKQVINT